jgi:4-hydroxyproline epimerase
MQKIHVIDSHTAGEPTRVIVSGGPDLGWGPLAQRLELFRQKYDHIRSAVVNEPRGSEAMVGALLCPPADPTNTAGVIFFNNVGFLGMCGHGTIGLVATLAYLGQITPGRYKIETPVGLVTAELHPSGAVTVHNVPSYRAHKQVAVSVPGYGEVLGDVAWGGNWFFLVEKHPFPINLAHLEQLTNFAWLIRQQLKEQGITGDNGQEIDHVELFGPPENPENHSRNFVLCPGKSYDRSPCGTGTSAKLACLYGDGKLQAGQIWRQESVVGTVFEGQIRPEGNQLFPSITGRAYINAQADLLLFEDDPFCMGIRG